MGVGRPKHRQLVCTVGTSVCVGGAVCGLFTAARRAWLAAGCIRIKAFSASARAIRFVPCALSSGGARIMADVLLPEGRGGAGRFVAAMLGLQGL